jgi:MFS family permease
MHSGELGAWFAVVCGLGAALGTYLGGEWASRRAAANEVLQLKVIALAYSVFGIVYCFVYLVPTKELAFSLMGLNVIGAGVINGPLYATLQSLVPVRTRATAVALLFFVSNLVGMGVGPLAAGALSDALQGIAGQDSLRYTLVLLSPGYVWAGWHVWKASKTVTHDQSVVDANG